LQEFFPLFEEQPMKILYQKKHGVLFLLCYFFSFHVSEAQISYFNSDVFWSKIKLMKESEAINISENDTVCIMASNRLYEKDSFRFLPDVYKGAIHYFVIYSHEGNWMVHPQKSLRDAIAMLPDINKDWVIYTEGMGKLFTTAADRAMRMNAQYDVNVIFLDYPSIKAKWRRTRNYYFSKHNATIAYKNFTSVFDTVRILKEETKLGNHSLNFFFHSMGNIVMEQIVKHDSLRFINQNKWVDNLIFNAACVPQHHHKKWVDKINFAKDIYILYNPKDFTLGGALLMSKKNQLGMKVKKPLSQKATYINFRKVAGKYHSNFLNLYGYPPQNKAAINLYNKLFHGMQVNLKDTSLYKPSYYKHIGWDILPAK